MTEPHDADGPPDPLLAELTSLFSRTDPIPGTVIEAARAALGWRRIDAELAELLTDSSLDEDMLAAIRGSGAPVRAVSFATDGLTLDLQIVVEGAQRTLLGQIAPPAEVELRIETMDDAAAATATTDLLGRFRVSVTGDQAIRLRIARLDARSPAVETSWIMI